MDTSQMACPKCGWVRSPGATECPACGIVYARYGGPSKQASPAAASPAVPPPLPPVNPYAPPQSNLQSAAPAAQMFGVPAAGVWQAGDLLVMQKGAILPNRCLLCNQPAAAYTRKKMHWHHPGLYFLVISPLIYLIVALIVRKSADLALPFCAEHEAKRKRATTAANVLIVLGLVLMLGSCTQLDGDGGSFAILLLLGFAILFAGAVINSVTAIVPKKIDDYYVWLRKVSLAYLATLPPAPLGPGMVL